MKAKLTARARWVIAALVVAAMSLVALVLLAPFWRSDKAERTHAGPYESPLFFRFVDSGQDPFAPPLDRGTYQLAITGDGYSATCSFKILERPSTDSTEPRFANIACRGDSLRILTTAWEVQGFYLPSGHDRASIRAQLLRNGRPFYDGTPGRGCPDQGFCIYPEAQ